MISVVTPIHNTPPAILARTWASLKAQTFSDWEWVIWDDSTNDLAWRQIYGFAADERYRIEMHKSHVHCGSIGRVKRRGFMVAGGDILVELDHDDELTPDALAVINTTFSNDSEIGFVYSDWCEILPDGQSAVYPDGWAFGFGGKYWSDVHGVWVMDAPPINEVTMGHIVSAPNHVRAWRSNVYRALNGHNPDYPVADDYELVVRTFLETRIAKIPKLLYKQHIGPMTAQRKRNKMIQHAVSEISARYAALILERTEQIDNT